MRESNLKMDFTFKDQAELDKSALFQGDLLSRTPALKTALEAAHPYYATAADYRFFMVLTQSCDLVRRGTRPPKSRYITIAAARPLSIVLERFQVRQAEAIDGFPRSVFNAERRVASEQLLERFLHNTESDFFFIRRGSINGVDEDLCVFLPLSVALRSEDHYEACVSSKIGELQDVFAAKVGWLTGNMYSRVGTPDLEDHLDSPEEYKKSFILELLGDDPVWFANIQLRWLRDEVKKWRRSNPGQAMPSSVADDILARVPASEVLLADRIADVLHRNKVLDEALVAKVRNIVASDTIIKGAARRA